MRTFFLNWPAQMARCLKVYSKLLQIRCLNFPNVENDFPLVFAHWHQDDIALLSLFGAYNPRVLVSPSRDGEITARAMEVLGFKPIRGSSSSGGANALRTLLAELQAGHNVVFPADGPRGPSLVAKPGTVWMAAKSGRPIVAGATVSSSAYVSRRAWYRLQIPKPGAKLLIAFSDPLYLPPEASSWPTYVQSRILTSLINRTAWRAARELKLWCENSPESQAQKVDHEQIRKQMAELDKKFKG